MNIECVESVERFQAVRGDWERLAGSAPRASIFTSWDWQYLWWKFYGDAQQLRILIAWEQGEMVGVAPFYIQASPIAGGEVRLLRSIGTGGDTSPDDLDPLLHPNWTSEAAARLAAFALESVPGWDVMMVSDLAEGSEFGRVMILAAGERRCKSRETEAATIHLVALPSTWEGYLAGMTSTRRAALRYGRKRIASLAGSRFFEWSDAASLDKAIHRLVEMHHLRWKGRAEEYSFSSDRYVAFHRELMHACLAAGTLRLYCLEAENKVIAMYYCYRFRQGIYHFQGGFDPEFATYSPGSVLFFYAIQDAIREGNTVFDMLKGEYPHKLRWGTTTRRTQGVVTYRRGLAAAAYRVRRDYLPQLRSLLTRPSHTPPMSSKD